MTAGTDHPEGESSGHRAWHWLLGVLAPVATERRLAYVQRALAAVVAVRVGLGPYRALAGQPDALWRPQGVTHLLGGMPAEVVILVVQVLGTAAALWVALAPTRYPVRRPAFAAAWLSLLVLAGLRTSLGKVLHNDVVLLLASVPVMLSTFAAGIGRGALRRSRHYGLPVATATAVVVMAYFFAGYQKVLHSGPAWVTGDNMANVMAWGAASGRAPFEGFALALAGSWWASRASAAAILGLELTFPLAVLRPRLASGFAAMATVLHVVGWLTLGLDYWAWVGVDITLLVDWPTVLDRVAGSGNGQSAGRRHP